MTYSVAKRGGPSHDHTREPAKTHWAHVCWEMDGSSSDELHWHARVCLYCLTALLHFSVSSNTLSDISRTSQGANALSSLQMSRQYQAIKGAA